METNNSAVDNAISNHSTDYQLYLLEVSLVCEFIDNQNLQIKLKDKLAIIHGIDETSIYY